MRGTTWVATLTATVAATYALDATATVAGVALVAAGPLGGAGRSLLLGVLAASYVAWGAGLRVNLAANRTLLERTGASTNLLSKAAHDLVAARTPRRRLRRLAADAGYVGSEVAKEVPYYAGAFGAALTDAVSGDEAIVFLAGANLGAALYEYGLAHLTHRFLRFRLRTEGSPSDPSPSTLDRPGR